MHFSINKCHSYSNAFIQYCQWYFLALTTWSPSFFFSAYLLIPSKELLAKSITPLVGLVTTPTNPLPIPVKGDSQVKLRFCKKLRIMARNIHICSMRIWQTFPQANYKVNFSMTAILRVFVPLKKPSTPSFWAPSIGFRTIPVTPSKTPCQKQLFLIDNAQVHNNNINQWFNNQNITLSWVIEIILIVFKILHGTCSIPTHVFSDNNVTLLLPH